MIGIFIQCWSGDVSGLDLTAGDRLIKEPDLRCVQFGRMHVRLIK